MTVEREGGEIGRRWRQLGWRRRWDLTVGGSSPRGRREAITVLGYARQMMQRSRFWALLGAASAFVVVVALELLIAGEVTGDSLILGGAISIGVGLGLELGGRSQARRLHRRAETVLAESSLE